MKISEAIIGKKSGYTLTLKENKKILYNNVELFFDSLIKGERNDVKFKQHTTRDKYHGRIETINYYLVNDISWIDNKDDWANLNSIGMIQNKEL